MVNDRPAISSSVPVVEHWRRQPGVSPGIRRCWAGGSLIIGQLGVWLAGGPNYCCPRRPRSLARPEFGAF